MISRILTASVLALSLSAGAFTVSAFAANAGNAGTSGSAAAGGASTGTGDNGGAAADPGANAQTGGAGAADNSGSASTTDSSSQKKNPMNLFYTDDTMKTMKTDDEITSSFNAMSADEQAAMRGNCDSDSTMKDACAKLPKK